MFWSRTLGVLDLAVWGICISYGLRYIKMMSLLCSVTGEVVEGRKDFPCYSLSRDNYTCSACIQLHDSCAWCGAPVRVAKVSLIIVSCLTTECPLGEVRAVLFSFFIGWFSYSTRKNSMQDVTIAQGSLSTAALSRSSKIHKLSLKWKRYDLKNW